MVDAIERRAPEEKLFLRGVREVLCCVATLVDDRPDHREAAILRRIVEPNHIISFRATWADDRNRIQVSRG